MMREIGAEMRPSCILMLAVIVLCVEGAIGCTGKGVDLAAYEVTFVGEWTEARFPKQYPLWRPPAQWSQVVGISHNSSFHLWEADEKASDAVRQLAETSNSAQLSTSFIQGRLGVMDYFNAPPIFKGKGLTKATFFANSNHSMVSLMSRIVPSPDWFVGVDSLQLCLHGKWRDSFSIDAEPMDAGTNNGFTFTSPKWATVPQEKISRITSQEPSHPASSFYYPHLTKLPRIGFFHFRKLNDYSLNEMGKERGVFPKITFETDAASFGSKADNEVSLSLFDEDLQKDSADVRPKPEKKLKKKSHRPGRRNPRPCQVTSWGEWSSCSKTCGFGESKRFRQVIKHARHGGMPCPSLQESKWCGSARTCRQPTGYFRW